MWGAKRRISATKTTINRCQMTRYVKWASHKKLEHEYKSHSLFSFSHIQWHHCNDKSQLRNKLSAKKPPLWLATKQMSTTLLLTKWKRWRAKCSTTRITVSNPPAMAPKLNIQQAMAPLLCMEVMLTIANKLHATAPKFNIQQAMAPLLCTEIMHHSQQTACHGAKPQQSGCHGSTAMHGSHGNHSQQTACHGSKKEGGFMHKIGDQLKTMRRKKNKDGRCRDGSDSSSSSSSDESDNENCGRNKV